MIWSRFYINANISYVNQIYSEFTVEILTELYKWTDTETREWSRITAVSEIHVWVHLYGHLITDDMTSPTQCPWCLLTPACLCVSAGHQEQEKPSSGSLRPSGWENQEIKQRQSARSRANAAGIRIQPGGPGSRPRYHQHSMINTIYGVWITLNRYIVHCVSFTIDKWVSKWTDELI